MNTVKHGVDQRGVRRRLAARTRARAPRRTRAPIPIAYTKSIAIQPLDARACGARARRARGTPSPRAGPSRAAEDRRSLVLRRDRRVRSGTSASGTRSARRTLQNMSRENTLAAPADLRARFLVGGRGAPQARVVSALESAAALRLGHEPPYRICQVAVPVHADQLLRAASSRQVLPDRVRQRSAITRISRHRRWPVHVRSRSQQAQSSGPTMAILLAALIDVARRASSGTRRGRRGDPGRARSDTRRARRRSFRGPFQSSRLFAMPTADVLGAYMLTLSGDGSLLQQTGAAHLGRCARDRLRRHRAARVPPQRRRSASTGVNAPVPAVGVQLKIPIPERPNVPAFGVAFRLGVPRTETFGATDVDRDGHRSLSRRRAGGSSRSTG